MSGAWWIVGVSVIGVFALGVFVGLVREAARDRRERAARRRRWAARVAAAEADALHGGSSSAPKEGWLEKGLRLK